VEKFDGGVIKLSECPLPALPHFQRTKIGEEGWGDSHFQRTKIGEENSSSSILKNINWRGEYKIYINSYLALVTNH
jgi:hypothetical protein